MDFSNISNTKIIKGKDCVINCSEIFKNYGSKRGFCLYFRSRIGNFAIENGAEKVVKDEEVVRVLEILEMATEVAKSHA